MQQTVLWKGDNLTTEIMFMFFEGDFQMFETFQATNRVNIAMTARHRGAFGMEQANNGFSTFDRGGQKLWDQHLFPRNHVHDGFAFTRPWRFPRAAVKGFVEVNMHVTSGG